MTSVRVSGEEDDTSNAITGGIFFHTGVQGPDVIVQLPPSIVPALSGRDQHVKQLLADTPPSLVRADTVLVSAISGLTGLG